MRQKSALSAAFDNLKQSNKTSFPSSIPEGCEEAIRKMQESANRCSDVFYRRSHPYGTASVIAKIINKVTENNKPVKNNSNKKKHKKKKKKKKNVNNNKHKKKKKKRGKKHAKKH